MKLKGFESGIFSIPNNSKQSEQSKQLNNYILSEPSSNSNISSSPSLHILLFWVTLTTYLYQENQKKDTRY